MAKNIRWQIPFVSLQGIHYRVDIYDEGTFTPIQLTAGPTPFVTNEDSSDDVFHPVRTQTGTLQVCTLKPDGTYITLDELLPADNIARPVRLINRDNSDAIEWQGFLSCEAYSQDYTGIPQILDLPVISVLEAMDSVEVELSESMAFQRILSHCIYAMKAIETKSGMSLFNTVFLDGHCQYETIANYFYNNVYFETDEQISGDNIVVEVHSISCKAILEQVAKFFGCCWREIGQNIYFEAVGRTTYYAYDTFINIYNSLIAGTSTLNLQNINASTANLAISEWMGTGHQRTVMQGMRRVKVSAKLSEFDIDMTLQETPVNNLVENPEERHSVFGEVYCNTNETFYNLADHKHMKVKAVFDHDANDGNRRIAALQFVESESDINYQHTSPWSLDDFRGGNTPHQGSPNVYNNYSLAVYYDWDFPNGFDLHLTSYRAYVRDTEGELQDCLVLCGVPARLYKYARVNPETAGWGSKFSPTQNNYLYKQSTPTMFSANTGYLLINLETLAWGGVTTGINQHTRGDIISCNIMMAIKWGNKWLHVDQSTTSQSRFTWETEFATFPFVFNDENHNGQMKTKNNWSDSLGVDEEDGMFVRIPDRMSGHISIFLFHEVNGLSDTQISKWYVSNQCLFDVFINKMEVKYVKPKEELLTDRSENTYATETSQAFRDELSLGVDLASYANNTKLATMVWESDGVTPVKLMTLDGASVRPEVNLLNRLASFYGAARQRLELEVAHPTAAPLPMLKLNGINDGKVYLPLSESRDWQTDVCKLTCFEMPQ